MIINPTMLTKEGENTMLYIDLSSYNNFIPNTDEKGIIINRDSPCLNKDLLIVSIGSNSSFSFGGFFESKSGDRWLTGLNCIYNHFLNVVSTGGIVTFTENQAIKFKLSTELYDRLTNYFSPMVSDTKRYKGIGFILKNSVIYY